MRNSPADVLEAIDRKAALIDSAAASLAKADDLAAAAARIREAASALFAADVSENGPALETSVRTAAALASNLVDGDPDVRSLRGRKAYLEAEVGSLAAVGIRAGFATGEAADELKRIDADIKARTKAIADRVASDARDLLASVKAGDAAAVGRLTALAKDNPRAFGPDAYPRMLELASRSVREGGDAAASILCAGY